ncbi:MAG: BMP family ABC transporter substrate-binding protein, partial [Firmicutes bacterium]|nr:BMP family ABC transporter substrate-binding protein [Bacillota bacterium]
MKVYYSEAFKSGKSYCKKCQTKGIDSELVVLDDLLDNNLSNQGVDIGQKYIPLEFVVGTKTRGRKKVFAGNFMPIQDEESEFAYKWERLCSSHLEEGIREPIKVYEYMNRYYVEEGNKRVSVLKFFKGYEILAQVKRIYPANKQDPKVQMYYDFLEFNRYSGLEDIEFTKKGAYLEFQTLLGKDKKEKWSEEETKSIHADYVLFRKAFEDKNGHKLHCSVGDAFLTYMKIFGVDRLHKQTKKEITACLSKIWEEIELLQEDSLIEVKLKPEGKGKKILNSINLSKKNIAFIYSGPIEESGWRKNHEKGRLFVQSALSTKIDTKAYIVSKQENGEDVLRKAIEEGAKIIFAPEVNLYKACIKVAAEHPHVKILNCSLNMPHKLVKSYYPRIYEAKFITGAIAGVLCENNKIGYICKYPIYGAIA